MRYATPEVLRIMKRVCTASIHAWIVSAACVYIFLLAFPNTNFGSPFSPLEFVLLACYVAMYTGIVVLPTCMLLVGPLVCLLPPSSPLRKPFIAILLGAITGPVASYLWGAAVAHKWFAPDLRDPWSLMFAGVAAITGVAFAFSYTRPPKNDPHV